MQEIQIEFMIEKKEGFGEDSEPLSFCGDTICAVGVFDGMGGSGAVKGAIKDNNEEHSQAYFASRMVKNAVEQLLTKTQNLTSTTLKEAIMQEFNEKIAARRSTSKLRSNLLRPYPTTMAFVLVENRPEDDYMIKSFWAGDSRNYLWTESGFYQISNDDLRDKKDPYENLKNDDVLSNCITSNGQFDINELCIEQETPFIVISASDGCFGYLRAPMYFERLLKDALAKADDEGDWKKNIIRCIQAVAADDVSLALRAVGFDDFNELKEKFVYYDYEPFKDIDDTLADLRNTEQKVRDLSQQYEKKLTSYWQQYKVGYMRYFMPPNSENQHSIEQSESKHDEEVIPQINDDVGSTDFTDYECGNLECNIKP